MMGNRKEPGILVHVDCVDHPMTAVVSFITFLQSQVIQDKAIWHCMTRHEELQHGDAVKLHFAICGRFFHHVRRNNRLMETARRDLLLRFESISRRTFRSSVLNTQQLHRPPRVCLHAPSVAEKCVQSLESRTGESVWKHRETR